MTMILITLLVAAGIVGACFLFEAIR